MTEGEVKTIQFGLGAKAALVVIGLLIGLAAAETALRFLIPARRGTEFGSLNELRSTILSEGSGAASSRSETIDGIDSGNLRAIINPHPDDRIIFDLKPNLDTTFQRVSLKTNSCGMRGAERSIAKPPDTFRIALLGDSFAFGWGVRQEESFAQGLEDNLNRLADGRRRFEVLNFGVPGYSTFQEVAKFKESGLDFSPDAILVFFVQNDFGLPFYVRDIYNPGSVLAATEFARLSWKAIDPNIEQQRLELLGYDPNSALRQLAKLARQERLPLFLTFNPRKDWDKDLYRLPILKKRRDIKVINLRPDFENIMAVRGYAEADLTLPHDPHPSPLRHAIYGDILTPYFMYALP